MSTYKCENEITGQVDFVDVTDISEISLIGYTKITLIRREA